MKRYPLKLTGIPKAAIWGGARLKTAYGKKADFDSIAESWELSVRDGATNAVENGEGAGLPLSECFEKMGLSSVLPDYDGKTFPLLVKLIDADQPLSVQVHPDDDYAESHGGGNGKTEMWVVIDAKPGAELVMGLADGVGRADFSSAVEKKKYDGIMKRVPVKPGDVFLGISTGGGSKNVKAALMAAKVIGVKTFLLTGNKHGVCEKYADTVIAVDESETYLIQELHLPLYHAFCTAVEAEMFPKEV